MTKTSLSFVHFCDHASMSTDGKLNLVGIFEGLFSQEMPTTHPQMFVLIRLNFPKGEHDVTVTLMQQDKVIAKTTFHKEVTKQTPQNLLWGIYALDIGTWEPIELKAYENGTEIGGSTLPIYRLPKPFKKPSK